MESSKCLELQNKMLKTRYKDLNDKYLKLKGEHEKLAIDYQVLADSLFEKTDTKLSEVNKIKIEVNCTCRL